MKTSEVLENTGVHAYLGQVLEHQDAGIRRRRRLDPHDRGAARERDRPAERPERRLDRA